jgi:hypothetical protein
MGDNLAISYAPQIAGGRGSVVPSFLSAHGSVRMLRNLILILFFSATSAFAQGAPPFYTNDPGTPGPLNWEINLGYMPFLYSDQSVPTSLTSTSISA